MPKKITKPSRRSDPSVIAKRLETMKRNKELRAKGLLPDGAPAPKPLNPHKLIIGLLEIRTQIRTGRGEAADANCTLLLDRLGYRRKGKAI